LNAKTKIHPWIRINRIVRDIPSQYILNGDDQ
jgi:histone acetyltransferase (RNA polymerase elongator complex component)